MALTKASADLVTYTPASGSLTDVQAALVPTQGSLRVDFGENGIATNSSDPVVNVNRNVDDAGAAGNGHCFSDSSNVTRDGSISYNSFDCRINVSGTENYGHFAPFQNGLVHNTSGTTSILYGYVDVPQVTNGTVGVRYGIKINDVVKSGSGAVTNNYAIWIDEQTASTSQKWGVVQKGASKNLFEGQTYFQSLINLNDTVIDDSATAGTRVTVGTGSSYDLSIMKADYSEFIWTVATGTNASKFWGGVKSKGKADGSIYTFDSDQIDYGTGAVGHVVFRNGNGIVGQIQTNGTATSYLTSSDYRLKENIGPLENGVDKLKALNPVSFDWKADGVRVDGFIAHETQEVIPEAVSGDKDATRLEDVKGEDDKPTGETITVPDYQGIDQSKLVPVLVAALQEAITRIEALESNAL
ncbi:MAG: tail fiber domain-containing protein [Flavobacteriaceae bacterium]|nr:tail fiber domain-containing protein [Flavobacteriaceae bacterium]